MLHRGKIYRRLRTALGVVVSLIALIDFNRHCANSIKLASCEIHEDECIASGELGSRGSAEISVELLERIADKV